MSDEEIPVGTTVFVRGWTKHRECCLEGEMRKRFDDADAIDRIVRLARSHPEVVRVTLDIGFPDKTLN